MSDRWSKRGVEPTLWRPGLLLALTLAWLAVSGLPDIVVDGAAGPYIRAGSQSYNWTIAVDGAQGGIQVDGDLWEIDYVFESEDGGAYPRNLWFIGRHEREFILVNLLMEGAGRVFIGGVFQYGTATLRADRFIGSYDTTTIRPLLRSSNTYVPNGPVPEYQGRDFRISTARAQIAPAQGRIAYAGRELIAYPVFHEVVNSTWHEIWALGYDAQAQNTYLVILYTITPQAWVVDLGTGRTESAALGRVVLHAGQVRTDRRASLP